MARNWYSYNTVGDPFLPSSYRKQVSTPGCLNGSVICAIYVPAGDVYPADPFSPNMAQYIADGLSNNVAEPAFPPGNKFYVYLKNL